jgi:hypothetical protein
MREAASLLLRCSGGGRESSNVAAANLLLDWQPLMWKEDQIKDEGPNRRERATRMGKIE